MFGEEPRRDFSGFRAVDDVRELRALAHPVRMALVEALAVDGPLTATEAAERIGETPTTCSFHLRQLAKFGFVEEAGGGKGRARPWRIARIKMRTDATHPDPEVAIATDAMQRVVRDRALARYRTWLETQHSYPEGWRRAAEESQLLLWLTADELEQLSDRLLELIEPVLDERLTDPSRRPAGALPVEMLLLAYPVRPPSED